ncbi:hypothetical protein [Candidatus Nanobsidianus stetteri]|uniref:Uncharacterized protein n=2 Tax=Nanobsidianus stetteri TaxID=1294122 RepID=A0A2T9WSM2_NANST|nr:hypothetical protein [Candidatus Nanobsidianus stetteri]MCC5446957.1 hypothetical protein [Candidatus Nanobsidianus stetteri]PVU70821.1 hypothetical protein DDW05_02190 [Candidatus Nanobsidianus stetteri]
MSKTSNNLNPEAYFQIFKLLSTFSTRMYEEELGKEFVKEFGEKLIEYAKNSYEEYQKELQQAHNKLPQTYREMLDVLLKKIDDSVPCKEENCLNSYEWSDIYQYIYKNHFKANVIRIINKHLEGLDSALPNYNKEIKNIRDVLITLSETEVNKTLFAAYMLTEYNALIDILSNPANSSINDKIFKQIKNLKASNDVQNYINAIQNYIEKQMEWIDLSYKKASEYIEDTIEELFHNNAEGFVVKMLSALFKYIA